MSSNPLSRRGFLTSALLGSGALGLRAAVTGLPPSFLLNPLAHATTGGGTGTPTFLILALSEAAEAWNCNAPGSYPVDLADPTDPLADAEHPDVWAPDLVPTVSLGTASARAAPPWADLLATPLGGRLAVAYHRTKAEIHPQFQTVRTVNGFVRRPDGGSGEMLSSAFARALHDRLGTLQAEPITLGPEVTFVEGRALDSVTPDELALLLQRSSGGDLARLRDETLDRVWGTLSASGSDAQRAYFESRVKSNQAAFELSGDIYDLVDVAGGANNDFKQLRAALAITKIRLSPVVNIHVELSGDNHQDTLLEDEVEQTSRALSEVAALWTAMEEDATQSGEIDMRDEVTFASLGTFGRRMIRNASGGRDHNGDAHAMTLFGPSIRPGVIGGVHRPNPTGRFEAQGIDPVTGAVSTGGIPSDAVFPSLAMTLAAACGIPATGDALGQGQDGLFDLVGEPDACVIDALLA